MLTCFSERYNNNYDGTNSTPFDQENLRLHMIVVQDSSTAQPMCQRVNTTALAIGPSEGVSKSAAVPGSMVNSWMFAGMAAMSMSYML